MPDRNRNRAGGRPEFEVAYWTKELGKDLQRQMLRQQLARFTDSGGTPRHGDDAVPPADAAPPAEDRAG